MFIQESRGGVVKSCFVFTDEAGAYKGNDATEKFRRSHPFYIRSNVLMSAEEYRLFQKDMHELNAKYKIPIDEEIKWDDLWALYKGNPRTEAIGRMSEDNLRGYYRRAFARASQCISLRFVFTITCVYDKSCLIKSENVYKFHLQNAFQRISMELDKSDFVVFVMDELNKETVKQIKEVCHEMTVKGDFLKYDNLYHGVLIENSIYSPGVQLADYAAGVVNGFIRGQLLDRGNYKFATDIYTSFVAPHTRCNADGSKLGFGIVDVPRRSDVRAKLKSIFDKTT